MEWERDFRDLKDWLGGITPEYGIAILKPHVFEYAKFAIDKHNRQMGTNLELLGVLKYAYGSLVHYFILIANDNGKYKRFTTAVGGYPWINIIDSVGLMDEGDYVPDANEVVPAPRRTSPVKPEVVSFAEFAVEHHNSEKQKQLKLVDIVDCYSREDKDCKYYKFTLLVQDQGKYMIFKTKVTKALRENDNFMESNGLEYVYEVHILPPPLPPPHPLIHPRIKSAAEFAVEKHNSIMGEELEFVDCIKWHKRVVEDDATYYMTIQVIDQGKHKIFETEVTAMNGGKSYCPYPVVFESSGLVYVSETQPCLHAQIPCPPYVPDWISSELQSRVEITGKILFDKVKEMEKENKITRRT